MNKKIIYIYIGLLILVSSINFINVESADPIKNPFKHYYFPINSFGIKEYTIINWSWIEQNVEYKLLYNNNTDITEYIVDFNFNNGSRKYTYNFTAEKQGYYTFIMEFQHGGIGGYIKNNTAIFNYTDENKLYYNYSDIVELGYNPIIVLDDDSFKFSVTKYCYIDEFISLDPYFGDISKTQAGYWLMYNAEERRFGDKYLCSADGYAVNMSTVVYAVNGIAGAEYLNIFLGIYEYIADNNAGALLGYTETYQLTAVDVGNVITLEFEDCIPISNGVNYFLTIGCVDVYGGSADDDVRMYSPSSTSGSSVYENNVVGYEDPWVGEGTSVVNLAVNVGYVDSCEPPIADDLKISVLKLSGSSFINGSMIYPVNCYNFSCYTYNVNTSNVYNVTINNSLGDTVTYNGIINQSVLLNFSDYVYINMNVTIWVNMTNGSIWWSYIFWFITEDNFLNESNLKSSGLDLFLSGISDNPEDALLLMWMFMGFLLIMSKETYEVIPLMVGMFLIASVMASDYEIFRQILIIGLTTCISVVPIIRLFKKF